MNSIQNHKAPVKYIACAVLMWLMWLMGIVVALVLGAIGNRVLPGAGYLGPFGFDGILVGGVPLLAIGGVLRAHRARFGLSWILVLSIGHMIIVAVGLYAQHLAYNPASFPWFVYWRELISVASGAAIAMVVVICALMNAKAPSS